MSGVYPRVGEDVNATLGVVFAGGGTGGHIQPGLAIAEALEDLLGERARAVFLVSDRAIDQRVLEPELFLGRSIERVVSPAKPMILRPKPLLRFIGSWGGGVRAARQAVSLLNSCDRVVMVATGGFVSAPAMFGARAESIERWVIDLDAVPGKANRLAARCATRRFAVGGSLEHAARPGVVGIAPIVRRRMVQTLPKAEARRAIGVDPERRTLLVTGGSQGAASVNGFVIESARRSPGSLDGWQVIHQAGNDGVAAVTDAWEHLGIPASVSAYIDRMDLALAASDAAVCRGGAGTVADLWATRTPALILPYPYHKDEHQWLNAAPLERAGGARVLKDLISPERNAAAHAEAWRAMTNDADRAEMAACLASLGPADGAKSVAKTLISLVS